MILNKLGLNRMGQVSPIILIYFTLFTIKYDELNDNPDMIVFQSLINNRRDSEFVHIVSLIVYYSGCRCQYG
jgi:hypothetical protein